MVCPLELTSQWTTKTLPERLISPNHRFFNWIQGVHGSAQRATPQANPPGTESPGLLCLRGGSCGSHGCDALYQGTTLEAGENSCFVSGHDFSRAVQIQQNLGFSPWFLLSLLAEKTPSAAEHYLWTSISCGMRCRRGLKPNSLLVLCGPTKVVP